MVIDPSLTVPLIEDSMKTMRKLGCFLLLAFLPAACTDSGAPSAPVAPSTPAAEAADKTKLPPLVKKGRKTVTPGGQGTTEQ